jgi:hypothetical protein
MSDAWLQKNNLDLASEWPGYSEFVFETKKLLRKKAAMESNERIL